MLDSRHVCRSRSRRTNYCRRFCRCSTSRRFDQLGLLVVRRIQRSSSVWLDCWTSVYCAALWNTFLTPLRLSKRRQGCFALHLWGIIIVACVQPAKVLNSVLVNGILPSGGDTKYVLVCHVMGSMASEYRSSYFQRSSCGFRCGEYSDQELWRKCSRQFSSSCAVERQSGIRNQLRNCRTLRPNKR
jgi:hypothetical protein